MQVVLNYADSGTASLFSLSSDPHVPLYLFSTEGTQRPSFPLEVPRTPVPWELRCLGGGGTQAYLALLGAGVGCLSFWGATSTRATDGSVT